MNDNSLLEDESLSASNDANSAANAADNSKKENERSTPGKKATAKKVSKVSAEPAKVVKPAAKAAKEPLKKAAAKKGSAKKADTIVPEPVTPKKAAAKKQSEPEIKPGIKTDGKPEAKSIKKTPKQAKAAKPAPTTKVAEQPIEVQQEAPISQPQAVQPIELPLSVAEPVAATTSTLRKIIFQLNFHTVVGQTLYVTGDHPLLGNCQPDHAFPLTYLNENYWIGTLKIPEGEALSADIAYNYILKNEDGTIIQEWGQDKLIKPSSFSVEELHLVDSWNASSFIENTYYTEPFQKVLLRENFTEVPKAEPETVTHIFRAKAPLLPKDHVLCIVGSIAELGGWSTENPLLLSKSEDDIWHSIALDLSDANFPFTYKYGVYDLKAHGFLHFEDGSNRVLYDSAAPTKLTVISDGFAAIPNNGFRGAGVAIPVFSLRSENSFGVGEFPDLKLMVDWAKTVGLKLIQLLPVNDTTATHTFTDSYPYAAISAFALHPLYLHLPAIVNKEHQALLNDLKEKQAQLNTLPEVDYVEVMRNKWDLIKQIFHTQKDLTFKSPDFRTFFHENEHWLVPYAAFSYFREQNKTSDFSKWATNQQYDKNAIYEFAGSPLKAPDEVTVYYYIQYHLHLQLRDATTYAHENGIIVKGDIPIGIYRYSCDAWQEPDLFYMDMQAGAPPDDFAVKGQNWGFPTYNWHRMRENGFQWWKKRFRQMSHYFDAFRIDHILGFFRIWSIPMHSVEGIMGHFVPAMPVHVNEIIARGVSFDYDRLCKPFINDQIVWEVFDGDQQAVKSQFLEAQQNGTYRLKGEFDTQRKVEAYFANQETTELNQRLKEGLFSLISNVILFEAEGSNGQEFHFRISMTDTLSFKHLNSQTQYNLNELYVNYFYRRQDYYWMKEAMMKLPELKRSTNMLICGEDLGMVPACVPGVMKELAILSLEIQRMPKDPSREFFHPNDAPYLSVVTPSTHDMSTIRGWWEEDWAATQRFFNNELGQWGIAPFFCEPWINRIIVLQHLYSPAMWSIFQLQDLLGMSSLRRENPNEERINVPANPKHYWRYRMHLTLEQLINEAAFTDELKSYVLQSGR
jgi:4-alpha-glucanotransferase